MAMETKHKLLFIPAVIVGVIIFVGLVKNRAQPEKEALSETARAVRIIEVPKLNVTPTLRGTGTVKPSQIWNAVAQVGGKIAATHPQLKKGAIIQAGEVLLKIDPSDYELAIGEAQTNIAATQAKLAETKVKESNSKASLKIETEALRIAKEELERKRRLVDQGTVTRSDFEKEERNMLAQQQSVQALKNAINLYPAERQRLQAELKRLQSLLQGARLNLERTTIVMPFVGRIAESKIEQQQFVRQGDVLVTADGIEKAEVEVDLPMGRLAGLVRSDQIINISDARDIKIGDVLGLSASVVLRNNGNVTRWQGKITRTSDTLDTRTRTVGFIIEVDKPYDNVQPGKRPPLVKGMFVEVELQGSPIADKLVLPRSALHNQHVYVVDEQNRLQRRTVKAATGGDNYLLIESGLNVGERVVVSDLLPAIEGMLLEPVLDNDALQRLMDEAQAKAAPSL